MTGDTFADRATEAARKAGAPLCVGLDPFADRIPLLFGDARSDVTAVGRFCAAVLELLPGRVGAVKPQLGLFEPYGGAGLTLAQELIAQARQLSLPTILDAKRGDIGTTAEGYAQATLGPPPGCDADCVTLNPFMGLDTIEPFARLAELSGRGIAVLVRTSNPGAQDFQDLDCGGAPLWVRVAQALAPLEARLMAPCGWSNLMIVAGATAPAQARRLRAILPKALFLAPGYGAQGASAADAKAGLVGGEGGLVSASRAILYPPGAYEATGLNAWRDTIVAALDRARQELSAA
jgi:orotidine-5'-phosphate decarboxylase